MNTKNLKILSAIIALSSLCLIALGGFVRATGAGLSCPDWPLCHNQAVPDFSIAGVPQEVGHRYLAFFVSLCIGLVVTATYKLRAEAPERWRVARWMIPVLIAQVVLGGLTVLMLLKPVIVTSHLVFGTILVQQFLLLATYPSSLGGNPKLRKSLRVGGFLILAQICLGGYVGSSGLALICMDIPLCGPNSALGVLPQEHIHMGHRILGILIFLHFLGMAFRSRLWSGSDPVRYLVPLLLLAQIGLGVANVWYHLPIPVALSHLGLAQLILAVVIIAVIRLK